MEGQLQRTHDHPQDLHHHYVMEGEGEAEQHNQQHGEKKSVLAKVKNKAKKIKDKITHAGGHAHEDDGSYDDYEEDEETVNRASHVRGAAAPMGVVSEPDFISGTALPKQTGLNPLEDRLSPSVAYDDVGPTTVAPVHKRDEMYPNIGIKTSPLLEDPYIRKQEYSGAGDVQVGAGIRSPREMEAPVTALPTSTAATMASDQPAPMDARTSHLSDSVVEPMVKIGPTVGLEEDPHCRKTTSSPNYQSKVADPTGQGSEEVDVSPLLQRLDNLHVANEYDEPESKAEEMAYTGSHDQFSPSEPKPLDAERPESLPRDTVVGKITAATSVITDKASSAKDAVASKLGYGGCEGQQKSALETVSEYGHRVAEQLAPVYEKAAGVGSAVTSKVQTRGGGGGEGSDKGVSVQTYLVEKFSPGEEDRELSKVITEAIHGKKEGAEEDHAVVKERVRVETVATDEKAAAGVVDRVKGAIGSWMGKNHDQGEEGLEKEIVDKLKE